MKTRASTIFVFIALLLSAASGQQNEVRQTDDDRAKLAALGAVIPDTKGPITSISFSDPGKVTDAGLEHLTGLTKLGSLSLKGTAVTAEGLKRLQNALPKCGIQYGPADPKADIDDPSGRAGR